MNETTQETVFLVVSDGNNLKKVISGQEGDKYSEPWPDLRGRADKNGQWTKDNRQHELSIITREQTYCVEQWIKKADWSQDKENCIKREQDA